MDPDFLMAHELSIAKRNTAIHFEETSVVELTINQGVIETADISQTGFVVNGNNLPRRPLQFFAGDDGRDGYRYLNRPH